MLEADAPLQAEPRRRGRPRREPVEAAPEANGVEADRLPPSLGISAANDADDAARSDEAGEPAPRPRRRRLRAAGQDEAAAD